MLEARFKAQSGATTGNGTALDLKGQGGRGRAFIKGIGSVSAGAIQLEEANAADYTGTWSPIGSPVAVPADTQTVVAFDASGLLAIRARISTTVADGTVDVEIVVESGAGA